MNFLSKHKNFNDLYEKTDILNLKSFKLMYYKRYHKQR